MEMVENAAFLAWLAEAGIADVSGPRGGSVWLSFAADRDCSRTWEAPDDRHDGGAARVRWLDAVVRAASAQGPWWLWRRGGGAWYGGPASRGEIDAASASLAVPRGFRGALGFAADEADGMMRMVRAFATWPWGAADDVYLVPGDRSCVVMLCHDEEIHVHAADRARLQAFGRVLAAFAQGRAGAGDGGSARDASAGPVERTG